MKHPGSLIFFLIACVLGPTGKLQAQFYAPDTEYHDRIQRVFVVEAARILAWWMDPSGTNLAEVVYDVTTKADQSTRWDIRWLDKAGKPAKTATVSYAGALLKAGPEFYRSVFKQLWLADWKTPPTLEPREVTDGFWRGAARMGLSREQTLTTALQLIDSSWKKPEREWMPELAGLLTHATLAGFTAHVGLDNVVLARGAAWLAFAEYLSPAKVDALWAPVLFRAGRERAAAQVWQSSMAAKMEKPTPQQEGWNIWLRKPFSKEVFLFATDSTNFPMAMPMLAHDAVVNGTGNTLADLIEDLAGSRRTLAALHNYAPLFATVTSISGGHLMDGAWQVYSRVEWLHLLSSYPPATNDYQGYLKPLNVVTNGLPKQLPRDADQDPSLMGLREIAPLLRLAHTEGVGRLIPVPVVSARDLLNYGWEMSGLQMGSRYKFVRYRWGVEDVGEAIYKTVTTEVEGLMPFFRRGANTTIHNYAESLRRLQMVEGLFYLVGYNDPPVGTEKTTPESAKLFVKRSWLRPWDFEWQARSLWDANAIPEISELIRAFQDQGGGLAACAILGYLSSLNNDALSKIPQGPDLKFSLADSLPQPTLARVRATFDRKFKDIGNFARAQAYERMYWQNPDSGLENRVLYNYIVSGSFKSARRFYSQARPNFQDPVGFSNTGGPELFVLGFCLDDAALRKQAMEDSRSASYFDMMMHIWDAAIRDQASELEEHANEMIERYEQEQGVNSMGRRLIKFLPLLPALRDPNHASRREALEYFGKDGGWTILRYIWIEKFKIPTPDAIVLLGGRENNAFVQIIIKYLEKDQPGALEAYNHFTALENTRNEQIVLGACLYNRLHPLSPPHEEPDLKPAGATSIRQAVFEKLKSTRN